MEKKGKGGPGKSYRVGITLIEAVRRFGDDDKAHEWFVARRWPDGVLCPRCDSDRVSPRKTKRKTPMFHCNACALDFTVKTGTIMHDSKLPMSTWALAFYLMTTNVKGISSMKLKRDLGINQRSAWHLAHRIRQTWLDETFQFQGEIEVDEVYIGGLEKNKHQSKRLRMGSGVGMKAIVAGARQRGTGLIQSRVVESSTRATLQGFVLERTAHDSTVYTDEHQSYRDLPRHHETVKHTAGEYVRGMASTNGMESHWALLQRGYQGIYHWMSFKHLHRYVAEFEGRHNRRPLDTEEQMALMVFGAEGKHLPWADLIA